MLMASNNPEMYRGMTGAGFGGGYGGGGINPNNMYGGGSQSGFLDFYNRNRGGGGSGGNPMISDQLYRGPYDGGFGGGFGRRPSNPYGGGFGGGFGGGYMAPLPGPYRNPYYMDSLRGGGMGQVMPTNIPFRDPGYGSPMLTQNLIQSLGGPQSSFRNTYRPYSTLGMLDRFRGGNMGSPYPMPYPMPSPGGKGGRMPMPGMPGKGGRMPGMPGKGGQMPPDQGMPPAGGEVPPAGTPPAGEAPPPAGGTPPADTTPTDNLTNLQKTILAEQGFTEQEARDAFDAIIQDQAGTLDPRFADLIGTGYYRRIGEAFGLKDAAGNPVTLGGTTTVAGGRQNTPGEERLAQFQGNQTPYERRLAQVMADQGKTREEAVGQQDYALSQGFDTDGDGAVSNKEYREELARREAEQNTPPADQPPADQPPAGESAPPPADAGSDVVAGGNPYYDSLTPEQKAAIDQIRQGGFNPYSMGIGGLYGIGGGMIPNFSGMRF